MSTLTRPKYSQSGFTLIEAIVVLAIFSILAAIAIPAITSWSSKFQLRGAARDMYSTLIKMKGEAAKRQKTVALSFGQQIDGVSYVYAIYEDDGPNASQYDPGEEVLSAIDSWPQNISLDLSEGSGDGLTFVNNGAGFPTVAYRSTGTLVGATGGTVFLKNFKSEHSEVIVSPTGAVRVE